MRGRLLAILLVLAFAGPTAAEQAAGELKFSSAGDEGRYRSLIVELRCLVCQNQSLADSDAELAKDLRDQVYTMIQDGQSDGDIVDYLVARYGDFVRYRPPFNAATLVLWIGPFLLLALGLLVLARTVRKRTPEVNDSESESGTHREEPER